MRMVAPDARIFNKMANQAPARSGHKDHALLGTKKNADLRRKDTLAYNSRWSQTYNSRAHLQMADNKARLLHTLTTATISLLQRYLSRPYPQTFLLAHAPTARPLTVSILDPSNTSIMCLIKRNLPSVSQ